MRRALLIFGTLLCAALLVSGCDFFRKLAGRPVSADIEAKRILIEREKELEKHRSDSLEKVRKRESDSLMVVKSLGEHPNMLMKSTRISLASKSVLENDYYVIIGSFGKRENAVAMASKVGEAGYKTVLISYTNGFTAVGVNPSDSMVDAYFSLSKLLKEDFCPADAWILDNRQ